MRVRMASNIIDDYIQMVDRIVTHFTKTNYSQRNELRLNYIRTLTPNMPILIFFLQIQNDIEFDRTNFKTVYMSQLLVTTRLLDK